MEELLTLYIVCITRNQQGTLVQFYATDENDAWLQATQWASSHGVILDMERDEMRCFPRGFTIMYRELPGKIIHTVD